MATWAPDQAKVERARANGWLVGPLPEGLWYGVEADGRWKGEAQGFTAAKAAAALMVSDGCQVASVTYGGETIAEVSRNEHGALVWRYTDTVRRHDGRA